MKIKAWNKTFLFLSFPIAAVFFFGLFFYQNSLRLIQNTSVVSNTVEEMTRIRKIRSDFKILETRERDFLKSGTTESLGAYNTTLTLLWQDFDHVGKLLQDNPNQEKQLFEDLKTVSTTIAAEYKNTNAARILQGSESIQEPVAMDKVLALIDDFQRLIIQMLEIETQLLKERNLDQLATCETQKLMSIIAVLITFLFSIITTILVYQIIRNNQRLDEARVSALKLAKESQEAKQEALEAVKQREEFSKSLVIRNFELEETRLAALNIAQDAKEAREKVEILSAYQKAIVDNAGYAIITGDLNGIITSFNPAAEKMLGYSAQEMIGKLTPAKFHDQDEVIKRAQEFSQELKEEVLPGYETFVIKARKELPNTHEWIYIRKDGSRFPVLLSVTILKDNSGNIFGFLGVASDISELKEAQKESKQAEISLRASETQYRSLFESMDEGYCIVEMIFNEQGKAVDFRYLQVNPSFEKQTGLKNVKGKRVREFIPDLESYWFDNFGKIVLTGQPARFENHVEGLSRWYDVYAFRFGDPENRQVAILFNDITERKRVEDEVKKKTEELARSNRELEQFAYVASHDLQEPLRMVASFTQLLEKKYKDQLDGKAKEYIHFAVDGAKRMQALIDDLLMFSRAGLKDVPKKSIDLNVVCQNVLKDLSALIAENKATVHCDPMPMVWANETQMNQLFLNLLGNGIKYKSERDPIINLSCKRIDEKSWEFTVSDNGIGIEEKYYDKLFVIFQRLHTKTEYKGTGIGLALCKKIVENYGGRIWVESRLGEGATFHFTLNEGG